MLSLLSVTDPFVVFDGYCEKPDRILNITIDNYDGGFQTGTYFRERGHKRALCIADNDICVDMERYLVSGMDLLPER